MEEKRKSKFHWLKWIFSFLLGLLTTYLFKNKTPRRPLKYDPNKAEDDLREKEKDNINDLHDEIEYLKNEHSNNLENLESEHKEKNEKIKSENISENDQLEYMNKFLNKTTDGEN